MNINMKQKLNKILNPEKKCEKIEDFSKNREKIRNISKISLKNNNNDSSNVSQNKTSGRASEKTNFSNFFNMKTVFKDAELSERKKTFNTFLKTETPQLEPSNSPSNNFFIELRKNTNIGNYLLMKTMHQKSLMPVKKRGLMFTNELWAEKTYRKIVNDSDLKPKIDYIKLSQKIKLFNEIMRELNNAYAKKNIDNQAEQNLIIDSIIKNSQNYENISFEQIPHLSIFSQKFQEFENFQNPSENNEKFKKLVEEKLGICGFEDKKKLEKLRVFRNRLLGSIKKKKFNRTENSQSFHRKGTLDVSVLSGNSENRPRGVSQSQNNRKPSEIGSIHESKYFFFIKFIIFDIFLKN